MIDTKQNNISEAHSLNKLLLFVIINIKYKRGAGCSVDMPVRFTDIQHIKLIYESNKAYWKQISRESMKTKPNET